MVLDEHKESGNDVLDEVLGAEADGQADHAKTRDQRADRDPPDQHDVDHGANNDDEQDEGLHRPGDRVEPLCFCPLPEILGIGQF